MADDPTAEVTILNEAAGTGETRVVTAGSLPGFTEYGWVVLDAAGRRKAQQPTTPTNKES